MNERIDMTVWVIRWREPYEDGETHFYTNNGSSGKPPLFLKRKDAVAAVNWLRRYRDDVDEVLEIVECSLKGKDAP